MSDFTKIVVSAALWLIAMAAQVSGFTNPVIAALFALGGCSFLGWAAVHHGRERHRAGKPIVEPSHLILIGLIGGVVALALVASGYAWQMFSRVPVVVAAGAAAAPGQPARKLSSAEIDERIKALTSARATIFKAQAFYDKYKDLQLNLNLVPAIKDRSAPDKLQEMADAFKPILDEIQDFAKTYRTWLPEIDRAFLGSNETSYVISIYKTTFDFRSEVISWENRPDAVIHLQSSAAFVAWRRGIEDFPQWISIATNNLTKLKREYND